MSNPFQPAIDELEKDLVEAERHMNGLRVAIGVLRAKAGLPPRPDGGGNGNSPPSTDTDSQTVNIRHDTFFPDKMGTAARRYLEMRFASAGKQTSPAKPREIFDAMKLGGFQFEAKDDNISMISLRNMLRKNTVQFQKLPNGTYGLKAWYPGAKKAKATAHTHVDAGADDDHGDESETSSAKEASAA